MPLAKRLAKSPNICAFKQGVSKISSTIALRAAVGKELEISVADEAPLSQPRRERETTGAQLLPALYQVGFLP